MVLRREAARSEANPLGIPPNRQPIGDVSQHFVAARVAPENQIMGGDVGIGHGIVVFHPGIAAKLLPPVIDGMGHFSPRPGADPVVERPAGRSDHEEAVHEGVVHGTLKAMALAERAIIRRTSGHPPGVFVSIPPEMSGPRAIGEHWRSSKFLIVEQDAGLLGRVQGTEAGRHGQRQGIHIRGLHADRPRVDDFGIHPGPLPVLGQTVHGHPEHLVVAERPGREANAMGQGIAAAGQNAIDAAVDLFPGLRMVGMSRVRSENMNQGHPFFGQGTCHDVGCLLLPIDGPAVGNDRAVEKVGGIVGAVVEVPELLLVPGRLDLFVLEHLQEVGRLGETGAGRSGGPEAGMVHRKLPAGRPTHREAAHRYPILINPAMLADVLQGFEQVHLAGELVGIAVTAVGMQHEGIRRGEFAWRALAAVDEIQLCQCFAPAVQPDVQPVAIRRPGPVARRHHQAVGLHRAVDPGNVAANDRPGVPCPG